MLDVGGNVRGTVTIDEALHARDVQGIKGNYRCTQCNGRVFAHNHASGSGKHFEHDYKHEFCAHYTAFPRHSSIHPRAIGREYVQLPIQVTDVNILESK